MTATAISFLRRGRIVRHVPAAPTETVLDYLRLTERAMGTKEGCNEGDCGACTVALGRLVEGRIVYEPANACILLMGHLHGRALVTVDDLAGSGWLHPVQQAMVEAHATQCGFCTPGIVMSLFVLHEKRAPTDRDAISAALAGNLCRCTGYRPIVAAAETALAAGGEPRDGAAESALLASIDTGEDVFIGDRQRFLARPAKPETLTDLAARHPGATLVAGAPDVGLWVTKQLRDLPRVIHTGGVPALREITETEAELALGAAVTYAEAEAALARIDPDVGELLRRLGSAQVRASGTIGGNIANGSPIGDMPPLLIALGARIELRLGAERRVLPIEDYFLAYGRQDRRPGELLWRVIVPKLGAAEMLRAFKVSKRFEQDISAVMAAFRLSIADGAITAARIAYGGMAATPKRARATEQALAGVRLADAAGWRPALAALREDFAPISDMRASAAYRTEVAEALLRRALAECAGAPSATTRVTGLREARR